MAGSAGKLLIILLTINVGLMFFGFKSGMVAAIDYITLDPEKQLIEVSPNITNILKDMLFGAGLLSLASAAIVGYFTGKENALYTGLATFFLTFATTPISLFSMTSIPIMVKAVLGVPLVFGYVIAIIGFFRGYEP